MTIREPSDLGERYHYWQLALEDQLAAEHWYAANEKRLRIWPESQAVMCGFFRAEYTGHRQPALRGQFVPIAIWLQQPVDDEGQLIGEEFLAMRSGHGRSQIAETMLHLEHSFTMTWLKCYRQPVTEEAYRYAMDAYASLSRFVWADDARPAPPPPSLPELNLQQRFF